MTHQYHSREVSRLCSLPAFRGEPSRLFVPEWKSIRHRSRRLTSYLGWCVTILCLLSSTAKAQPNAEQLQDESLKFRGSAKARAHLPTLASIDPGTTIDDEHAERWNRIILLARPSLASGDIDTIPASIRGPINRAVSTFVLAILATVKENSEGGQTEYELSEVGAAISANIGGQLTVLTANDASAVGAKLSFIQSQLLARQEAQLENTRVVGHSSTITVFDVPGLMFRDGRHEEFTIRHFIWINKHTGAQAALLWLLQSDEQGFQMVSAPLRWLPAAVKENRKIHMDASEVNVLGIPTDRAFALEGLPPGKDVQWAAEFGKIGAISEYDHVQLKELTLALNRTIQDARQKQSNNTP